MATAGLFEEDGIQEYLREVGDHRILTREDEVALFQRVEAGDDSAREEIVGCNLRFVIKIALQFRRSGLPLGDLIQEGNIGLLQVIDKFDWRRGFRFSTYAAYYIRQEIQAAIHRGGSMIRLPIRKARLLAKINEFMRDYNESHGCEPSAQETAEVLGVEVERVEDLITLRHSFTSIDMERGEEGATLKDTLPCLNTPSPSEAIARAQSDAAVCKVLDFLTDREREVVELRYGLRNGRSQSLRKASKVVGLSQEGVRRVEQRALGKLRRPAIRQGIEGLLSA